MPASSETLNQKVARQVLTQTLRVRKGENVTIEAWSESLPWAAPFINETRRLGAHPLLLYEDESSFWDALRTGRSRSTGEVGEHEWSTLAKSDAYVFFFGPSEWPRYDELADRNTAGVAAYNPEWYRRAAKAKLRGARMYLGRTSALAAKRWEVDLDRWREALQKASLASPQRMHQLGERIARRLQQGKKVRVSHANGTDLEFRLSRYPVQLDDGLVDEKDVRSGNNMASIPGGVIGVAIDHTSAHGSVVGNHTVYPNTGPADGIRWDFEKGQLGGYSYGRGAAAFEKAYSAAPKNGRDRLGFISIGLNPELSSCPQMEDQEMGAVLLRIGGNTFVGGKNKCPFGSWMTINDADLAIDGRSVLRAGRIV